LPLVRYFFPPNADPYYHEVSNASVGYLNDLYGPAMAAEFDRQGIPYFTSATFDLFYAVRKTPLRSQFTKSSMNILPRQAQDKHGES